MKSSTALHARNQKGFTLIELSIVLVIIGLIVGGVLVGQDLIKAAEVRATVGQIEKYNAAANTFRTKYNGLPGDITSAANFGFTATNPTTINGDNLIQGCTANDGYSFACETSAFWDDLSHASLIEVSTNNATPDGGNSPVTTFSSSNAPPAKMGAGSYILVGAPGSANTSLGSVTSGFNYFFITGPTTVSGTGGVITGSNSITPTQAYQIDTKLDDGVPTSGVVVAYDDNGALGALNATHATFSFPITTALALHAQAAGFCQKPANTYNIANANDGTVPICSLAVRTTF